MKENVWYPHNSAVFDATEFVCRARGVRMNRSKFPSVVPYPIDKARTHSGPVDESAEWDAKWLRPNVTSMRSRQKPITEMHDTPRVSVRAAKVQAEAQPEQPKLSLMLRFLHWLFPDVNQRRAKRFSTPGLVAYYWTGGAPYSYNVGDMSATGLFLLTKERWAPGTLIQMTLQRQDGKTSSPEDSICVLSEVVRWGENGSGFNFILSDYEDVRDYGVPAGSTIDRKAIERFMQKVGVPHS